MEDRQNKMGETRGENKGSVSDVPNGRDNRRPVRGIKSLAYGTIILISLLICLFILSIIIIIIDYYLIGIALLITDLILSMLLLISIPLIKDVGMMRAFLFLIITYGRTTAELNAVLYDLRRVMENAKNINIERESMWVRNLRDTTKNK